MTSFQQYRLRWTNHRTNLLSAFEDLLHNEAFTDVTLAVDHSLPIKCHKIVLAACSTYFQNLFHELPSQQHPIVVLKDVKYAEIKAILQYMYCGEVNVAQNQLPDLLKIAQVLKVKGLVEEHGNQRQTQSESAHDLRREDAINASTSSPPPAISTSTDGNCASHSSPPHSTGIYSSLHGKSGVALDHVQTHLASSWSMPLLSGAGHQFPTSLSSSVLGGGSYDNSVEATTSLKRRKMIPSSLLLNNDTPILRTVLGQAHVDSSQSQSMPLPLLQPDSHEPVYYRNLSSNGSANDADNRRSSDLASGDTIHGDIAYMDENERQSSPQSYAGNIVRNSAATECVLPRIDNKRYKQYTRKDIDQAIAAVKHGMSAVQAARKYGVPSRTLYDKVKKLGIPTSRPFKRSASNGGSGAGFPFGIGANVNGALYDNSGSGIKSENTQSENEKIDESGGGNTSFVEGSTGASTAAFETTYTKASKDTDYDSMSDSMTHCNTSPVISCTKQRQEQEQQEQQQDLDDQVEDLSVSRKPYDSTLRRVIVRPPSNPSSLAIKDETIKEDTGLDNNDCYS